MLAISLRKQSLANAESAVHKLTAPCVFAPPIEWDLGALLYKRRTALVKIGDRFYTSYGNKNGP